LIGAGIAVGVVLALVLGQSLASLLFGVRSFDPLTLLAVTALLSVAAVLATLAPAWRAVHVDPAVSLRGD
jgi:putative ABC transport system permease protein